MATTSRPSLTANATWVDVLRAGADAHPDRLAFRHAPLDDAPWDDDDVSEGRLTYGDLDRAARAVAVRLRAATGGPVLLLQPPGPDFITAFFGCLYAGVTAVPAYPPSRHPRSLERVNVIIGDCGARTVLTVASKAERVGALLGGVDVIGTNDVDLDLADRWKDPGLLPEDTAFVQYTSGSTSAPRGVILSHRNLLANCMVTSRLFGTDEDSRVVSWLPTYHDMGLIGAVLGTVYAGASCALFSPTAFVERPARWLETISRFQATVSGAPNFAYDLCVARMTDAERAQVNLDTWKLAFCGAEPVRAATIDRFTEAFAERGFRRDAFTPCYGLAEASLLVTAKRSGEQPHIDARPPQDGAAIPRSPVVSCGPAPDEHRLEVVDVSAEDLDGPDTAVFHPVGAGEVGEIWVQSPAVANGYLGRPEQSKRVFGAQLAHRAGRWLRTGDLGYLRAGELHVVGRVKDVILVRGRTLHAHDIERTVEDSLAAVRSGGCAAVSVDDGSGETLRLVVELDRAHTPADPNELRALITATSEAARAAVALAHGVTPSATTVIRTGGLPRTSSGKLRRGECRRALLNGELPVLLAIPVLDAAPAAVPPGVRNGVESVRAVVASVLGVPATGCAIDRPLAALGVDSLGALRIRHELRITAPTTELDDVLACSVTSLAGLVDRLADSDSPTSDSPASDAREDGGTPVTTGDKPLGRNQLAQWFGQQARPLSRAHIITAAVEVTGDLDVGALDRAAAALAARHPALRTVFPVVDGSPVRRVLAALRSPVEVAPCSADPAGAPGWLEARTCHPFDLEAGPLWRVVTVSLGPGRHLLGLGLHHIIADLWSVEVLVDDLARAYRAARAQPDAIPVLPASTREGVRPEPTTGELTEARASWASHLAGAGSAGRLPGLAGGETPGRHSDLSVPLRLGPEVLDGLRRLGREQDSTLFAVVLAAVQRFVGTASVSDDVLIATPLHGRDDPADADAVGYLADVTVLRSRLGREDDIRGLIAQARDEVRAAHARAWCPFPDLVRAVSGTAAAGAPTRLPEVVLTLHPAHGPFGALLAACAVGEPGHQAEWAGLDVQSVSLPPSPPQFDLAITLAELDGALIGRLQADGDQVSDSRLADWARDLEAVLTRFAAEAAEPAAENAPSAGENAPSPGTLSRLRPTPVHELFVAKARRMPRRPAVRWGDVTVTYASLDARANRLAHQLRHLGVGPETLVGVLLPRGVDLVIAILAVAKAGGAYLPLDTHHPGERLDFVLRDARPSLLLVDASTRSLVDVDTVVLDLDQTAPAIAAQPAEDPGVPGDLDRLAYVIYTSGSSGRPKGVQIEHRGLAALFPATADLRIDHTDVWTLFHSPAFDFSVWEMWGPLVHGGTLVVVPADVAGSPAAFWNLVEDFGVTVLNQTPAVFAQLTAAAPDRLATLGLRHIVFGGEKLESSHLDVWRDNGAPGTRLTNMYGITEVTVHATYGPLPEVAPDGPVTLGEPLAGSTIELLDPAGIPVAPGEVGEIVVGGVGVARGYLGRPGLTAARFVPDPARPGAVRYRSGDLARRRRGRLEYLGRADDQVKIFGHRIEPGEVAAAIERLPGVARAVVGADRSAGGTTRLVAHVLGTAGVVDPDTVRSALAACVPSYLVPAVVIPVTELPLTANGKVDRRALPAAPAPAAVPPGTPTERLVVDLITTLLDVPEVGCTDDLFALGWHSLLMAQFALRIGDAVGVTVPLGDLFADPTARAIAAAVDAARVRPGGSGLGTDALVARDAGDVISRVDRTRHRAFLTGEGPNRARRAQASPAELPAHQAPALVDSTIPRGDDR